MKQNACYNKNVFDLFGKKHRGNLCTFAETINAPSGDGNGHRVLVDGFGNWKQSTPRQGTEMPFIKLKCLWNGRNNQRPVRGRKYLCSFYRPNHLRNNQRPVRGRKCFARLLVSLQCVETINAPSGDGNPKVDINIYAALETINAPSGDGNGSGCLPHLSWH